MEQHRVDPNVPHFPKLESPFIREGPVGDKQLTDKVNPEYEWVFEQAETVRAVEKLNGKNLCVTITEGGNPSSMYRRDGARGDPAKNGYDMVRVPLGDGDTSHYTAGIVNAYDQGLMEYIDGPGTYFGELIGPLIQGNPYNLDRHYWVPFAYARERLVYESYGEHSTDYETLRQWFLDIELPPLFYPMQNDGIPFEQAKAESTVEGIVFTHPDPDSIDGIPMAKLRRDMFETAKI